MQFFSRIITNYAIAMFNVAKRKAILPALIPQLKKLADFVDQAEAIELKSSAALSKMLSAAFKGKQDSAIPIEASNLLSVMSRKNHLSLLKPMTDLLVKMQLEESGISVAYLTLPKKLDDKELNSLQAKLSKKMEQKFEFITSYNPKLIGGFRLAFNGLLLDDSWSGKLNKIKFRISNIK